MNEVAVVVPTLGRPSLRVLLEALWSSEGPPPARVVLVDDRRTEGAPLDVPAEVAPRVLVLRGGGHGPAAARNLGWRGVRAEWIAFLDDDVVPSPTWLADLAYDLGHADDDVAGVSGRVEVPLPADRRPTDWERGTAGLASARWITADLAYRRRALVRVGGFDERFPRAYREDADLALRVTSCAGLVVTGRRQVTHPVRPARWDASWRQQAGNRDDALMARLHGAGWRERAAAPRGRLRDHAVTTAALVVGSAGALAGSRGLARAGLGAWAALTARFAWQRIAPGPRTPAEVARMVVTSALIPPSAVRHRLAGELAHRDVAPWEPRAAAVLFDRDGTLIHDVPYNADPEKVQPVEGAVASVGRARRAGLRLGVVTNQSAVARRLATDEQVRAVNARVDEEFGGFDTWQVCPHAAEDACACRKPRPGMVLAAAAELGVEPRRVVVVGDIGADVDAAVLAGARAILVPTTETQAEEVRLAPLVVHDLDAAMDEVLA